LASARSRCPGPEQAPVLLGQGALDRSCSRNRALELTHDRIALTPQLLAPSLGQFIAKLPETNVYSLALGVGTIIIILSIKRFKPLIPGALVALVVGTAVSSLLKLNELHGVAVVGVIPTGMTSPTIPRIDPGAIAFLIAGAAGIVSS
jgi:MFS superfamily sulfate permease-like transporter